MPLICSTPLLPGCRRLSGRDRRRRLSKDTHPNPSLSALEQHDEFIAVTSAPAPTEIAAMLAAIGADSLDQLIDQTVPAAIRLPADLPLPAPKREHEALATSRPSPARM
jgi:hypothetical protein